MAAARLMGSRMRKEVPHLKRPPSEYLREHFWFCTQPIEEPEQPQHIVAYVEAIGWDRLMFSSDYPHWDFDDPRSALKFKMTDAQRAGIATGDYSATGQGAGGQVRLLPVTIARLGLGPASAEQVPAMVAEEGALSVSLLGQTYLSRLESVAIEGDRMILR